MGFSRIILSFYAKIKYLKIEDINLQKLKITAYNFIKFKIQRLFFK